MTCSRSDGPGIREQGLVTRKAATTATTTYGVTETSYADRAPRTPAGSPGSL
jgi:hypothetical protein